MTPFTFQVDKRGFIVQSTPPILQRLGINPGSWLEVMGPKGHSHGNGAGGYRLY
ncbi:MAG: hypothetical protein V7731_13685 [Amphritea sp.]